VSVLRGADGRWCLEHQGVPLVDPWALQVSTELPWCLTPTPWPAPQPVTVVRPWAEQVVYELGVRAFTARHPLVAEQDRGTFRGLAHPAVVGHLVDLGVTAVELLPVAAWETEPRLQRLGLSNWWGYNSVAWAAPEPALGTPRELARCVDVLHAAGIAVILDVVLNHTSEGPDEDPVVRHWRHLAPGVYLRGPDGTLDNRTGCGNTVDLSHPLAARCALDALRHWALAYGVDGFRFDLAPVAGPLLPDLAADPVLSQRWLIAEPWDAAGGRLDFPEPWATWSGSARDAIRGFWLQESISARQAMGAVLTSSRKEVCFVTCHDGFTLRDLTSYAHKHNEANGEDNRDGSDHNLSDNAGVEGPTQDPQVRQVRHDRQRALLATLLLGPAVPMLSMGDELGFTQDGNNNGYCQPFEVDWSEPTHTAWIAELTQVRRELTLWRDEPAGPQDVRWLGLDGTEPGDWDGFGPLVAELPGRALLVLNPLDRAAEVAVTAGWSVRLSSGTQPLGPRSVTVFVPGPDPHDSSQRCP
jgi:isoamylase